MNCWNLWNLGASRFHLQLASLEIATYQPDTKSNANPNPNPNPITKQHEIVNIQLNIVACPTYPDTFIRDNVVAPSVLVLIVIVTMPMRQRYEANHGDFVGIPTGFTLGMRCIWGLKSDPHATYAHPVLHPAENVC